MARQPRVFINSPLRAEETLVLREKPAHYLLHVLRMKPGQTLTVFDGQGGEYSAEIIEFGRKEAVLSIGLRQMVERESPLHLVLAQGVSRADRMDYTLQKAVELGVSEIMPVIAERTQRRDPAWLNKRMSHWSGVMHSACEQCGRNRPPTLHPPCSLNHCLDFAERSVRLVLSPAGEHKLQQITLQYASLTLLIGPEGGFSEDELQLIRRMGCFEVSLGPRILRTETAGIAALAICQARWGDL